MKKRENVLLSKQGMTLTEMLVALALLMLIIFTFLPLFMSTYRNIYTSGQKTQQTFEKTSLMERLISSKGNNAAGYESSVTNVPLKLTTGGTTVSFGTQAGDINRVSGTVIASGTSGDQYTTFYTAENHSRIICFPTSLTDDFLTTDITLVPKGFDFAKEASNKNASSTGYHFEVHYTPSTVTAEQKANPMLLPKVPTQYYDITYVDDSGYDVAVFTLKGGNNIISFENSPIVITYSQGTGGADYYASIELGAPEIIFVGDKASDGSYYYYVTSGVDSEGRMDLIARKMTGDSELKSNMNDVEWVSEGRGDDGNGGVNDYGYYVMGGDAGQVRRFWRNDKTGNYYWGGDNLVNYNRYAYLKDNGTPQNEAYENLNETLTTQAEFKSIYRSSQNGAVDVNGVKVNETFDSSKAGVYKYKGLTSNYFTANLTTEESRDKAFITLGKVAKIKGAFGKMYRYYGCDTDASRDEFFGLYSWLTPGQTRAENLNVSGYKDALDYEYEDDTSLITITSVGAVQINTSNANYYQSQGSTAFNSNVYPTKSYTLYCGYIPSVLDLWGYKTGAYTGFGHLGTLGIAYSNEEESWYPVGKFADIYTKSNTLSPEVFGTNESDLMYKTLLNYNSESNGLHDDVKYPDPSKGSHWYTAGQEVNGRISAGLALPGEGTYGKLTSGQEVDVTIGYLSHPFAIALNNPEPTVIEGMTGSDWYYRNAKQGTNYGIGATQYDHEFLSLGLRDNVTMLDLKSFHDDITGNNISLAVGYSLSYLFSDHYYLARLGQVFNSGLVYIRSTGDGTEKDDAGNLSSGKGWSLKKETNIFHQFFGADQYYGDGNEAVHGWDTDYHRAYFNIIANQNSFAGNSDANTVRDVEGRSDFGTNCHPMAQTECSTCNWGITWDEKPQTMWGTKNGTILSWYYNYQDLKGSKITSVLKEFENYMWADRIGATKPLRNDGNANQFYDYNSVNNGMSSSYGFVSVLSSINDIAYGADNWVAVGNQSGKAPSDYCASNMCYTGNGNAASYINVKYCYSPSEHKYAWKAVKVADQSNIDFISVTYSKGVWYALGYVDEDNDNENDPDENCVIFYSTDPAKEWKKAQTRTKEGVYRGQNPTDSTNALYYDANGNCQQIEVNGLNSMASQG